MLGTRHALRRSSTVATVTSLASFEKRSRIFSLIQPTGVVHLGNYLGALKNWKDILKNAPPCTQCLFGTAELHSLTQLPAAEVLRHNRYGAIAAIIASGVDPQQCSLFHQSSVPEHCELYWVLTCLTSIGALNRMTQWKLKLRVADGSDIFDERVMGQTKAGIFQYPVLQAADILLYNATHVPVGEDQSQHLELSRTIAQTFNRTYGDFFTLPKTILTPTKKILALRNPAKKMSKSDPDHLSAVYLNDDPDTIARKFRKAVTDSIQGPVTFEPETRPGVANLVSIIAAIQGKLAQETVVDLAWVQNHKQLKDYVTEVVVEEFREKRVLYDSISGDKAYIDAVCAEGREKAREVAVQNLKRVKELVGLL
ncbi:tryptophanyl-tRNA synthetase [Metschnikowia bicuspidata]|uniref:Tryptophan--tRNA ligase, mitochondrial n=1 Tax=Metschnikowia bicuspidata TaxID=27322 RepID=A0A4V1J2L9_9ASCO|nr:tryptophanyl-tRNA synthetase [Metschnikowia bicuspidata]